MRNEILLVAVTLLGASMVFKCDDDKLLGVINQLQAQIIAKDEKIDQMLTDSTKQNLVAAEAHRIAVKDLEAEKKRVLEKLKRCD